jgi:hypothetical protein
MAGCAGGARSLVLPTAATSPQPTVSATISIMIPSAKTSSSKRHVQYVSSATKSMTVAVSGQQTLLIGLTPSSPGCTEVTGGTQCNVSASMPVGTYPVTITLYGSSAGNTDPLAIATTIQTVNPNTTNTLSFTLNAVVSLVYVALSPDSTLTLGTAATRSVILSPRDSSGATIVLGRDSIVDQNGSPVQIQLGVTDTTGSLSVSPSIAGGTPSTLSYNGGTPNGTNVTVSVRNGSNVQLTQAQTSITMNPGNGGVTPMGPTTTYYVKTLSNAKLIAAGYAMRSAGQSGLVILDFGYPFQCNQQVGVAKNYCSTDQAQAGVVGTFLPPQGQWVTDDQIIGAAEQFLDGFADISPPTGSQHLELAVGTSNFCLAASDCDQKLYSMYGQKWAEVVSSVQNYIADHSRSAYESAAGANDIETWCGTDGAAICTIGPTPILSWFSAYSLNTSLPMYDYGSLDGCGTANGCPSPWTPGAFVTLTSTQNGYAIPEIYCTAMSNPWVNLAAYASAHGAAPVRIAGTLSAATRGLANGCSTAAQPLEAFNDLKTKLVNGTPASASGMRYYTDIQDLGP